MSYCAALDDLQAAQPLDVEAVRAVWRPLDSTLGRSFPAQVVSLGTALTAAVAVYLICCRLLRVRELDALLSLRNRLRGA